MSIYAILELTQAPICRGLLENLLPNNVPLHFPPLPSLVFHNADMHLMTSEVPEFHNQQTYLIHVTVCAHTDTHTTAHGALANC